MKRTCLLVMLLGMGFSVPAAAQMNPMDVFEHADANGDGLISLEEFKASRAQQFGRMDRNGDGVVAKSDFGRILQMRPQIGERLDAMITAADANRDGRVTRAEFLAAPTPMFGRADVNRDGVVDKAELAQAREAVRQQR